MDVLREYRNIIFEGFRVFFTVHLFSGRHGSLPLRRSKIGIFHRISGFPDNELFYSLFAGLGINHNSATAPTAAVCGAGSKGMTCFSARP